MARVYVGAPYPLRAEARVWAHALERCGLEVTAGWLTAPETTLNDAQARLDLVDLRRADVLLLLNPPEWADRGTGGRHVEFGYALAADKVIVIVGVRSNLFHHLEPVIVLGPTTPVDTVARVCRGVCDGDELAEAAHG